MTLNEFMQQLDARFDTKDIKKINNRYFQVPRHVEMMRSKIRKSVFSAGTFLGEKDFNPSPALIDMIARHSDRKAFVNKKSEWLFLCNRDVLESGIVKSKADKGYVLVQNEKDENLGYGQIFRKGKSKIIRNLVDKGEYLRMEKRKR